MQSEFAIEYSPPFNGFYNSPSSSWTPAADARPVSSSASTYSSLYAASLSPTWTGDHDYVSPPPEQTRGVSTVAHGSSEPIIYSASSVASSWTYEDAEDIDDDEEESSTDIASRVASERDEIRASNAGLAQRGLTAAAIVAMPQNEYVKLTRAKHQFTLQQMELIKEIRRHGGNKEAAKRSRQKKLHELETLQNDVAVLEQEKALELSRRAYLMEELRKEQQRNSRM